MNAGFRWKQFGLRGCLLLVLTVSVFFAGYRVGHSQGRYQRSQHPPDAFDDLIAEICSTTKPSAGSSRWKLHYDGSVVDLRTPPSEADDDPFARP